MSLTTLAQLPWRWIAIGLLSLALWASMGDAKRAKLAQRNPETHRLWKDEAADAKKALAASQRDLGTCRANTATLQASLDRQSAATRAASEAGRAATAEAERQASEAKKSALAADKRARAVMAAKSGPDRCASAMSILRGEAG